MRALLDRCFGLVCFASAVGLTACVDVCLCVLVCALGCGDV